MLKKVFLFVICLALCACTTVRRGPDTTILEYQRQVDRLEEELRNRDRAIENSLRELETITRRSEAMGGNIDDIIRELDLYHAAVQRLLRATGYGTDEEPSVTQDTYESY